MTSKLRSHRINVLANYLLVLVGLELVIGVRGIRLELEAYAAFVPSVC